MEGGKAVVFPVRSDFLASRGRISVGQGDIATDIEAARSLREEKYR